MSPKTDSYKHDDPNLKVLCRRLEEAFNACALALGISEADILQPMSSVSHIQNEMLSRITQLSYRSGSAQAHQLGFPVKDCGCPTCKELALLGKELTGIAKVKKDLEFYQKRCAEMERRNQEGHKAHVEIRHELEAANQHVKILREARDHAVAMEERMRMQLIAEFAKAYCR